MRMEFEPSIMYTEAVLEPAEFPLRQVPAVAFGLPPLFQKFIMSELHSKPRMQSVGKSSVS